MKTLPLQKAMCATCPWQKDSPHAGLVPALTDSACASALRICHSTGGNNAINRRTGKPRAACVGARKVQLKAMASLRVIAAPNETAWQAACDRIGIKNGVTSL